MNVNLTGPAAALCAFLGIWVGHVSVRRIEFHAASLRLPVLLFFGGGLILETLSLLAYSRAFSAALGILGITLLWDALELIRQQRRVCIGHAPANPGNPRHARILEMYPSATTEDLLEHETEGSRM